MFVSMKVRGIGRPLPGSIINFVGFYIFCIPVGAGLAFGANLAAFGLWWGIFAGLAASCACYYVFLYIIVDWKEEERKAVLRVSEETGMTPLPETLDEESSGLIQDIDLIDNDESDEE
jgi:MATE family multidrug resistance protein